MKFSLVAKICCVLFIIVKFAQAEDCDNKEENEPKSRQKRHFYLWCMNFPDCCNVRGRDICGFACPKCPIKLDKCKSHFNKSAV